MKYLSHKPSLNEVAESYAEEMEETIEHATELKKKLKKVGTPRELQKIIQEIDTHQYAIGISSVALYQYDRWVEEMGYGWDEKIGRT